MYMCVCINYVRVCIRVVFSRVLQLRVRRTVLMAWSNLIADPSGRAT